MQAGARAHVLRVTAGPNARGDTRRDRGSGGGGGARQKFSAPKRLIGLDTNTEVRSCAYSPAQDTGSHGSRASS